MSSNSSKQEEAPKPSKFRQALRAAGVAVAAPAWTLAAVFGVGAIMSGFVVYLGADQLGMRIDETSAMFQMLLSVCVYLFGSAVLLIEPYAIRRMSVMQVRELIGLARWPVLKDLGYGLLAWAGYMLLTIVVTALLVEYAPGIDLNQDQDVGFTSLSNSWDVFYAFLVIVVAAPFIEELAFRGYLYGTLKPYVRWIMASLITSVLFGVVHGQLNVGIDTFLLSMVLCYLRDKTGSIWSGVFVHALKNSIAFYILFVAPKWLSDLIMGM